MVVKAAITSDWEYRIRAVKKITAKRVKYIQDHEWELEDKIRENGKPTLEILGGI